MMAEGISGIPWPPLRPYPSTRVYTGWAGDHGRGFEHPDPVGDDSNEAAATAVAACMTVCPNMNEFE